MRISVSLAKLNVFLALQCSTFRLCVSINRQDSSANQILNDSTKGKTKRNCRIQVTSQIRIQIWKQFGNWWNEFDSQNKIKEERKKNRQESSGNHRIEIDIKENARTNRVESETKRKNEKLSIFGLIRVSFFIRYHSRSLYSPSPLSPFNFLFIFHLPNAKTVSFCILNRVMWCVPLVAWNSFLFFFFANSFYWARFHNSMWCDAWQWSDQIRMILSETATADIATLIPPAP